MRSVVIGFGSTLRSDDGIGPCVAKRVARLTKSSEVLVLARQVLTPDLASDIHGVDRVVFIDASVEEAPGTVREQWLKPQSGTDAMAHTLQPGELLEWCQRTYGSAPEAVLITVGGRTFEVGEALSLEVKQALPHIVRRTLDLLR